MKITQIIDTIAGHYGITAEQLRGANREPRFVKARHLAMLAARQATRASFPEIGREFGARHHTSVLHGVRQAASRCKADAEARDVVAVAVAVVNGGKVFYEVEVPRG